MAKRILLSALVNVLGDFVDGLTEENLAVGVWSGKIVLNRVQLNRRAIEKLNLSVTVEHGFIETLEVVIPWTALESQPVKILIDGVFLLVSAIDLTNLTQAEAFERNTASRVATLIQSEKSMELAMQMSQESGKSNDTSYFQRLTTKIVDNLEVELRNVHLRYEDQLSIPACPFSCGITLDSFTISTTDSDWTETFIARKVDDIIHKLAKANNAGIYWNNLSPGETLSSLPIDVWVSAMKEFIYRSERTDVARELHYILQPPNTLSLKLIHNDMEGFVPKLVAVAESSNLTLQLDKEQYHQAMRIMTHFQFLTKKQQLLQYRPVSSVHSNPKAWWKYALVLLTNKGDVLSDKMHTMMTCCHHRSKYISLLVRSKTIDTETGEVNELSPAQRAEIAGIEEIVPLTALVVFRQLATQKSFLLNQKYREEAVSMETKSEYENVDNSTGGGGGWWSWLSASSYDDDSEHEKETHDAPNSSSTVDLVDTILHSSGHDALSYTMDFELLTHASLSLTSHRVPVATLDVGLHLNGAVRASYIDIVFAMTDILLIDNQTVNPVVPNIISVRGGTNGKTNIRRAPFSVSLLIKNGKTTVKIAAMPLEICLNKFCIQQLLSLFQVPDNEPPAVIDKQSRLFQSAFDLTMSAYGTSPTFHEENHNDDEDEKINSSAVLTGRAPDSLDIVIDIQSPKIMIPEDSSVDMGCLILDTGHLIVNGSLSATGMSWLVSLRAINADMPATVTNARSGAAAREYLIRPFGVNIMVQTINRVKADMTVEIEVVPNIRGELDALKLSRLMHTIDVISSTFNHDDPTAGSTSVDGRGPTTAPITMNSIETIDPERVSLDISFSVQEVTLTLCYDDCEEHRGVLSVTQLFAHIQSRVYDTTMQFNLGALAIEDSLRVESQKYLARTPLDDSALVKISYVIIEDVKSPCFIEHDKEVSVQFSKLNLHLDAATIQFLRPFYEVVLGRRLSDYPPETPSLSALASGNWESSVRGITESSHTGSSAVLDTLSSDFSTTAVPKIDDTMHVTVTLEVISLELFRSSDKNQRVTSENFQRQELKSVTSIEIQRLHADVTLTNVMNYDVSIHSVFIADTRDVSREYKFKTLFCPDGREFDHNSSIEGKAQINRDQISIQYREAMAEEKSLKNFFEISVLDLMGYISLDTILDVLAIILDNFDAVLFLVNPEVNSIQSTTDTEGITNADESFVSLNVHVLVPNPRLFFLEDPTTILSKAIVGRCSIDYSFNSEEISRRTVETNQSINLGLTDVELFVLFSMTKWNPRQILYPVNVNFFTKSSEENSIVTTKDVSFNVDTFNTRVSLSDIILAQSILLRRTLIDNPPPVSDTSGPDELFLSTAKLTKESDIAPPESSLIAVTGYTVALNVDMVSMVLINDFKGKNLPIVQGFLQKLNFSADGVLQDLRGTGSFTVFAESFNGRISEWETIFDRWSPRLQLSSCGNAGVALSLLCNETIQLSLTSTFLECILQTQSLMFMLNEGSDISRRSVARVVVKNLFEFPVLILLPGNRKNPSVRQMKDNDDVLFRLEAGDEASIFALNKNLGEHTMALEEIVERKGPLSVVFSSVPSSLRLHFPPESNSSSLHAPRISICTSKPEHSTFDAPLQLNRSSRFNATVSRLKGSSAANSPMKNLSEGEESVVEEVFENQRYTPLSRSWLEPFLVNDPHAWTTFDGGKVNRENVQLPNSDWEWQHDWKIDRWTYKLGAEIDEDGFEYALRFGSFIPGKPRLCSHLDCVRRRRWVRTRSLKFQPSLEDIGSKATNLFDFFWDSHLREDGCREIALRSSAQIRNNLSYDICVRLYNKHWDEEYFEFGPVSKDSIVAVPFHASDATSMQVKPLDSGKGHSDSMYQWSQALSCTRETQNFSRYQDLLCVLDPSTSGTDSTKKKLSNINNLPIRCKTVQEEKSLLINLTGYLEVYNLLPCTVEYRCFNSFDLNNIEKTVICAEEGALSPGQTCNLTYVSLLYETFVMFRVGSFCWSPKTLLSKLSAKNILEDENKTRTTHEWVEFPNSDGSLGLLLRMEVRINSYEGRTSLRIYSKNALIDRTGLGVCIRSDVSFASKVSHKLKQETMLRSSGSASDRKDPKIVNSSLGIRTEKCVSLQHFSVKSDNEYNICVGNIGGDVHTDRKMVYSFLPPALCGQTCIITPCEDRAIHLNTSNFLQFKVMEPVIVLVLVNKLVSKPPRWIRRGGFRRLVEHAISKDDGIEIHYDIYGMQCSQHSAVELGSNFSKDACEMYTVFVVGLSERIGVADMLEQIAHKDSKIQRLESDRAWSCGGNGLTLFDTCKDQISVGTSNGMAWTKDYIKLNTLGTSAKGNFEIYDRCVGKIYQLAYNVQALPSNFDNTNAVTIMPQYCLVNCLDEVLEIRQHKSAQTIFVDPHSSLGWHKEIPYRNTTIQLRCATTKWSFGNVDVNEIGTSSVLLPNLQSKSKTKTSPVIINIEVKIAEASDMCMVTITFWKSKKVQNAPISIRNESRIPISLCQNKLKIESPEEKRSCEITAPAQSWTHFGWADPEGSKKVIIAAGDAPFDKHTRTMSIDTLKLNVKVRLPVSDISLQQQSQLNLKRFVKEVVLTVESSGSGVVMRVYEQNDNWEDESGDVPSPQDRLMADKISAMSFVLSFSSFGISVVADEPFRREILSLYIEGMKGTLRTVASATSFEFSVQDLQIDNYCETVVHPVLFRRVRTVQSAPALDKEPPFIQFVAILENHPQTMPGTTCKYVSLRVLEFALELDSGSIQIILEDFLQNLSLVSKDQALALQAPEEWMDDYNKQLLAPEKRLQLVDTYKAHMFAQQPKIVFENVIMHPIKASLTFLHTDFHRHRHLSKQRSVSNSALDMLTSVVEVELMVIKLNSFIVSNAVESIGSLLSRIEGRILQGLKGQLAQMAGSLTILGSPVGLARNIGDGVGAFFYEPYQGLVLGPQDFLRGLGRGTSSLVAGFVSGTLTSTAALVNTASSGISYLSGDADFVRDRSMKMQKLHASRSGAIEGLIDGGDLLVKGFTSGITGLVSQPLKGAQHSGAQGFVKGIGLGVAGALVKPTLGVTDGFSSAAAGISNEVGFTATVLRARPARAFQRSRTDPSVRVLAPLSMAAAEAQEFVRKNNESKKLSSEEVQEDSYIASFKMDNHVLVIFSELKLYLLHKLKLIRVHHWSEISHCYFSSDHVGVLLYSSKKSSNPIKIYFKSHRGVRLYQGFLHHSYLMGNPPGTLPLDQEIIESPSSNQKFSSRYIFGSAKAIMSDLAFGSENELLKAASQRLEFPNLRGNDLYATLDEIVTWLAHSYVRICSSFNRSRCCVVLIINSSNQDVKITDISIIKGRVVHTLDAAGVDNKSPIISRNDGFIVLLGCGFPPSFYETGDVELSLSTSEFNAVLCSSNIKSTISVNKKSGLDGDRISAGFVEKSSAEWWSKYCIFI